MADFTALKSMSKGETRDAGKVVVFAFEDHDGHTHKYGCPQEALETIILSLCFLNVKACEARQRVDPSFRDLARERMGTLFRVKQFSVGTDPTGELIGLTVETEPAVAIDLGFLPVDVDPLVRLLREAKATAEKRRQEKMH